MNQQLKRQLKLFGYQNRFTVAIFIKPYYFLRQLCNRIRYGASEPCEYLVYQGKGLVYLVNSKVAQTSLTSVRDVKGAEYLQPGPRIRVRRLSQIHMGDHLFTFVRNPFDRLYSCYHWKYHTDVRVQPYNYREYDYYLWGYLSKDRGFPEFVNRVCRIPDRWSDRHFVSQYFRVFEANKLPLQTVGRFESLETDFEQIRNEYGFEPLPHMKKTTKIDWRSAYTPELVELVYKRYQNDFETWYPDAREELIGYLSNKD